MLATSLNMVNIVKSLHCAAAAAKILVEAKADVKAEDENGKTAENLAEDIKEDEMAAFLKACASGKIPAKAPAAKVREARVFREVIPLEGCGEGCANPNE